jgi:hypothetical protein
LLRPFQNEDSLLVAGNQCHLHEDDQVSFIVAAMIILLLFILPRYV